MLNRSQNHSELVSIPLSLFTLTSTPHSTSTHISPHSLSFETSSEIIIHYSQDSSTYLSLQHDPYFFDNGKIILCTVSQETGYSSLRLIEPQRQTQPDSEHEHDHEKSHFHCKIISSDGVAPLPFYVSPSHHIVYYHKNLPNPIEIHGCALNLKDGTETILTMENMCHSIVAGDYPIFIDIENNIHGTGQFILKRIENNVVMDVGILDFPITTTTPCLSSEQIPEFFSFVNSKGILVNDLLRFFLSHSFFFLILFFFKKSYSVSVF